MKLIYCIRALYNPGGMERVLLNKVTYLVEKLYWDVTIITTDQQGLPSFYSFPNGVRMIDLGINYADDNEKNVFKNSRISETPKRTQEETLCFAGKKSVPTLLSPSTPRSLLLFRT